MRALLLEGQMRFLGHVLGLVLATSLGACATSFHSRSLTKEESRALPPQAVIDIVVAQVGDILIFDQPSPNPNATRPLDRAVFFTRPRPSGYAGLCTSDQLLVTFAPTNDRDQGARTPVRAASIETWQLFRAPGPLGAPEYIDSMAERDHASCRDLDPRREDFFEADDQMTARAAIDLLPLVSQRIRNNDLGFDLACDPLDIDCQAILEGMTIDQVQFARRCTAPGEIGGCYYLQTTGEGITIRARQTFVEGARTWRIQSVRVEELIVLYHSRAD